ncbi:hypothetical protein H4Q26_007755 [Puccinia striiformis f. sp. tritici PST-130]|nr:hypothetical protein H4Q26_007755 [Puccinia striiformis f. sp. tritici PST-130]
MNPLRLSSARSRLRVLAGGTALLGGTTYYYYHHHHQKSLLQLDSKRDINHPANQRPPLLWTPPSRSDMINALKASKLVHQIKSPADLESKQQTQEYDLLVIGGGATGAGVALDAASRGLKVALVERDDFSSGTSSKSTKLVHGGVRYLQKAVFNLDYEQYKLVREALHERKTFLHIAPHLSLHLPIMLPVYKWWQVPYFYAGCKMYDLLAGSENMETSYLVGKGKALENFPMLKADGLCGAVVYYDGSHNDSRMNMALIMSAVHQGAVVANHMEVVELHKKPAHEKTDVKPRGSTESPGVLSGARLRDQVTGEEFNIRAKGIINATGPFCDGIRKLDDPSVPNIVAPSSGVHITLPSYYAPSHMGLIDPATSDGRVIFFLPWQEQDPLPKEQEIQWVLGEVRNYLSPELKVRRGDVLSAWCGLRPLVRDPAAKDTQSLVRNHMVHVSPSGLLTIAGGKWTTYRAMAEETVDAAISTFNLKAEGPCVTKLLQLIAEPTGNRWPVHGKRLDPSYPYLEEEVRYVVRNEYAITPVDIIARRTRLSFLNAQAALEVLPRVIDIMSEELGWTNSHRESAFEKSKNFLLSMGLPKSKLKLSLADVRRGLLRKQTAEEGQLFSRAMFSPKELTQLRKEFADLDSNGDGVISPNDLQSALEHLNFANVPKETVDMIVSGAKTNHIGAIDFSDFLDIAVAAKEVSLSNKLQNFLSDSDHEEIVVNGTSTSSSSHSTVVVEPNSMSAAVGVHGNEVVNDGNNDAKAGGTGNLNRVIPVERSGGGT